MDLKILKQSIEKKQIQVPFWIFKYEDNDFLPNQYISSIRDILKIEVEYLDNLDGITAPKSDIFGLAESVDILRIFSIDCFDVVNDLLLTKTNLIVVCKKVSDDAIKMFNNNIVVFPKLEPWQIKDFVYSMASGVSEKKLDYLINICKGDIYRLNQELNKIKLFTEQERKFVYDKFIDDGVFEDLSDHNIFDFTNAIIKKDIKSLVGLYKELEKIDVEPLGLVTTLYNNLKNIIMIQLSPSATAESLGMPSNKFWAIKKYNCGYYTKEQLIQSFRIVTDMDRRLKTGELTTDLMIDYIVCNMLS